MKLPFILLLFVALLIQSNAAESGEETLTDYKAETTVEEGNDSLQFTSSENKSYKRLLSKIIDETLANYTNHKILPNYYERGALPVQADVEIREILRISEVDMNMKLNLVLDIHWNDPDLLYEHAAPDWDDAVWVDDTAKNKIWKPTISILNEEDSAQNSGGYIHDALEWYPDGELLWTINLVTTVSCSMSLEDFPMDEQNCSVLIGSPNHEDFQMNLTVVPYMYPVFSSSVKNFELIGVRVSPIVVSHDEIIRTSYAYELLLRRYVGYYVIGTYFPSALIVIISWLAFWMAASAAGERMTLGVTCVLTITTLLISSQASSPKVSYIKAIDIYMGICFTLVFTTLIQSTAVGFLLRKVTEQTGRKLEVVQRNGRQVQHSPGFACVVRRMMSGDLEGNEQPKIVKLIQKYDVWCRWVYPVIFFAFNVAYWAYYLTGTKYDNLKGWEQPKTYANVTDFRL